MRSGAIVYDEVLRQMREHIRALRYVMTLHAEEEMNEDGLSIYDVENCILMGTIVERQTGQRPGEWKYCIVGQAIDGTSVEIVARLGPAGRLVIITIYVL
jgi:hypothetical protein